MNDERRHDIDALRALAFGLLILYHVGMYYVADWPWHIKSPYESQWLKWPMQFVNVWRMDLVFLVSGVAFGFLSRGAAPLRLIGQRAWRLMLPLVFGMLVVVPYQAYAQAVANGSVSPDFVAFMLRYWSRGPWPRGAFDGSDFGITWNHLWYLPYLFAYTAVLSLALPLLRSAAGVRARAAFNRLRGGALLFVPALPLLLYTLTLAARFPATHDFIHDGYLHTLYFTVFLFGYWIGVDTGIWRELDRLRKVSLALGLALVAAYFALRASPLDASVGSWLMRIVRPLYLWTAITTILGFAHHHLNRPWGWLAWANESVYPWYMLHQTLIIVGAVALAGARLGPIGEPVALVAFTVLGCWLLTDGVIRRVRWLRPLFGLKPMVREARQPARPAPVAVYLGSGE